LGFRKSPRVFHSLDQLETNIWANLPIFTNTKSRYRDDLENNDPLYSTVSYKQGLFWCDSDTCQGQNLISPRANERICCFCGHINDLSTAMPFSARPEQGAFTQILPDTLNPFLHSIRADFGEEPNLSKLGIEVGLKKYQAGMRARFSLVIRKGPIYEIRKGFEFGSLNGGSNNRFSIPTNTERKNSNSDLGHYKKTYLSVDPTPTQPVFEDESFLLGPPSEPAGRFPVTLWG